jgi:hypothetical protein
MSPWYRRPVSSAPGGGKISDEDFGAFRVSIVVDRTDVLRDESGGVRAAQNGIYMTFHYIQL